MPEAKYIGAYEVLWEDPWFARQDSKKHFPLTYYVAWFYAILLQKGTFVHTFILVRCKFETWLFLLLCYHWSLSVSSKTLDSGSSFSASKFKSVLSLVKLKFINCFILFYVCYEFYMDKQDAFSSFSYLYHLQIFHFICVLWIIYPAT